MRFLPLALLPIGIVLTAQPAATQPIFGPFEVTCDTHYGALKKAVRFQDKVVFRIWNAEVGGSQISAHEVRTGSLVVTKVRTVKMGNVPSRKFARITAAIGDVSTLILNDAACSTGAWLDLAVGIETLPCDLSSLPMRSRRRLRNVGATPPQPSLCASSTDGE
jgi:hypothetical protein